MAQEDCFVDDAPCDNGTDREAVAARRVVPASFP